MTDTITTKDITFDIAGQPLILASNKITNSISLTDTTPATNNTIPLAYPNPPIFQAIANDIFHDTTLELKPGEALAKVVERCKKAKEESNLRWAYDAALKIRVPYIEDVKILCPNKVLQFTFKDETIIKTICLDSDQFNFEFAFYLAYAKYLWQKVLTPAGVERKAREYTETKFFVKLVNTAFKTINKKQKEEERLEKEKKKREAIVERRAAKKTAKAKKKREARITEMVEAINRACE